MASVKEDYHTVAADEIDWWVFQINCLHSWHLRSVLLIIIHGHLGIAECNISYLVES